MRPEDEGGGPGSKPLPGSVSAGFRPVPSGSPAVPGHPARTGCCPSHPARQGGVGTRASGWVRSSVHPGRVRGQTPHSRSPGRPGAHLSSRSDQGGVLEVWGQSSTAPACSESPLQAGLACVTAKCVRSPERYRQDRCEVLSGL